MRLSTALLLAIFIAACGDPNSGASGDVVDAHVVRVVESGDRDGAKFQRLVVQLDASLFRGESVEVEWGGRRAINENGFLAPGDRVLLAVTRDGNARVYTIAEVTRLPSLWPLGALLVAALVAVARIKGLAALAGLAAS